ncbi:MAG: SRPBCC domain-containing protein [Candidatus Binatota bacterium]
MRFEKEIEILNSKEKVWAFLWDVDRFITCVPGCKEAKTAQGEREPKKSPPPLTGWD